MFKLKNAFAKPGPQDGRRVLIERLWPLELDVYYYKISEWARDLAPSYRLMEWLRAHPGDWEQFKKYYLEELEDGKKQELIRLLAEAGRLQDITLLYAGENDAESPAGVIFERLQNLR